jgi:hypothetical protein
VEWDVQLANNSTPRAESSLRHVIFEHMFVQMFPNGCRPRYVCVQFRRPSPHVLLMRLSRFRSWPFVAEAASHVQCSTHFTYDDGDAYTAVADHRLFVSLPAAQTTAAPVAPSVGHGRCDPHLVESKIVETVGLADFNANFSGGLHCRGRVQTDDDSAGRGDVNKRRSRYRTRDGGHSTDDDAEYDDDEHGDSLVSDGGRTAAFKLILLDCPTPGHESEQSYRCIDLIGPDVQQHRADLFESSSSSTANAAAAQSRAGDLRLLTETGDDGDVLCWWFPHRAKIRESSTVGVEQFYLLPGAACYDDDIVRWLSSSYFSSDTDNDMRQRVGVLATFTPLVPPHDVAPELLQELPASLDDAQSSLQEPDEGYSQIGTRDVIEFTNGNVAVGNLQTSGLISLYVACLLLLT